MALEDWAFAEVERGRDVDALIRDLVEGTHCVAAVGIAATLALHTGHVSATTLPLVTSQRLWHADIRRLVSVESSGFNANEMYADRFVGSAAHVAALKRINARPVRRMELRALASLFAVSAASPLRDAFADAVRRFPEELPFAYASEATDLYHVAALRQTAELWAEFGNRANYVVEPAPDGRGAYVTFENPKAQAPHVEEAERTHAELSAKLAPFMWAIECFKQGRLTGLPLAEMVARAQALDAPGLFERSPDPMTDPAAFIELEQSGVVGTAAALLSFGPALVADVPPAPSDATKDDTVVSTYGPGDGRDSRTWAVGVVHRAACTPSAANGSMQHRELANDHPAAFAAAGLGALLRDPVPSDDVGAVRAALLGLVAHPIDGVGAAALAQAIRVSDAALTWAALGLAVECAIGDQAVDDATIEKEWPSTAHTSHHGPDDEEDVRRDPPEVMPNEVLPSTDLARTSDRLRVALERARHAANTGTLLDTLPKIPGAWAASTTDDALSNMSPRANAPATTRGRRRYRDGSRPPRYLRTDRIARVLRAIPLDLVLATSSPRQGSLNDRPSPRDGVLSLADELLHWTISRCNRPERGDGGRGAASDDRPDLPIQWLGDFMGWLASLGASLSADELRTRYLGPIVSLRAEARAECLRSFVPIYVAAAMIDPLKVADGVVALLCEIFEQLTDDDAWRQARRNPSRGLASPYQTLINALLAVDWDTPAPAAARFANGDWSQVRLLQPVVRAILAPAGDIPQVLNAYLRLVELSFDAYGADDFLAEVGLLPASAWTTRALWMSGDNAARIAALLQRFAERERPLSPNGLAGALRLLDRLVDVGDRRSAALQVSELFAMVT